MNYWTKQSIELATTKDYLDQLFKVYPISRNELRRISGKEKELIKNAINNNSYKDLILETCINSKVSPIKDSYIGFLKQDQTALDRNPETVNRLGSILSDMGYNEIIEKMERPAESNRQMGQAFRYWIDKGTLGIPVTHDKEDFIASDKNMILNTSDRELGDFARIYLGYGRNSGLDFLCRYNKKYIIGEAKFISANGGNQNNQLNSAMNIFTQITTTTKYEVIPIAILDGIIYLEADTKMYQTIKRNNNYVLSALFLRDFIYQI